jgi:hypothetical protein
MDIREILQALDKQDHELWSECRTAMRRVYLIAHNKVLGLGDYEAQDDDFMDLIDVKLALLFDRAGSISTTRPISDSKANDIEKNLLDKDDELKKALNSLNQGAHGAKITGQDEDHFGMIGAGTAHSLVPNKDDELKKNLADVHRNQMNTIANFKDREFELKVAAGVIPLSSSNLPNNEWK